jgi:uncharacterized Tic20 family protein
MPDSPGVAISLEDRPMAVMAHLSGLAGYIIPFGGVIVPIIIWMVKKDVPIVAAIARQAVLLNVVVFLLFVFSFVLWLTIILIPLLILFACALGISAVALPIVGAIKANGGIFYRYPVVGANP